ncbi:BnaCnng69350D [Brassica napus]|uniref:Uncharacterized protein n=3 Tax=Brassica TaxID=3705 RepID=A0A0D3BN45_BRAOL|nr:hypothetical protein Bca52824_038942 [Brassica carinata]CAF1712771.1 unnamed protein product [Brassica napus]CDY70687.1 BnaCnng69350D [Brassica napus]
MKLSWRKWAWGKDAMLEPAEMVKLSLYTPPGRKAEGEGGGHWAGSISSEFPVKIEAPIKKIL